MRLLTCRFQIYESCAPHVLVLNWPDRNAETAFSKSQGFKTLAIKILDRAELKV